MDEGSADREDARDSARPYCEAYCQGEHVLKNEGKSDEDGTQRREHVRPENGGAITAATAKPVKTTPRVLRNQR